LPPNPTVNDLKSFSCS